jgi:hypothetical protein
VLIKNVFCEASFFIVKDCVVGGVPIQILFSLERMPGWLGRMHSGSSGNMDLIAGNVWCCIGS